MTIDEAIEKNRKIAEMKKTIYDACILEEYNRHLLREYKENEQLAEWLEELKCYKNDNDFSDYAERLHKIAFNSGYNKAIDDFKRIICEELKLYIDHEDYMCVGLSLHKFTRDLAEQLKAGGENENFQ